MSGHSKWSTIKRDKAINDNARGKVFSKLSRGITIAVKTGGGPNPDSNYRLRIAIDAARAENMPKDTIDRAINKAITSGMQMDEVTYEGFGPAGVNIIVQAATDNRNRTAQEIKSMFEKAGGTMGQPGSVSFNFTPKGYLLLEKTGNMDAMTLALIDLGAEEIEEAEAGVEVNVPPTELFEMRKKIEDAGMRVIEAELIQKPKLEVQLDQAGAKKLFAMLETLEAHDDVQKVFDNASIT